jgi:hypothetical protein
MSSAEFEPKVQAFERAKTVYALDRAVTVIRIYNTHKTQLLYWG